MRRLLLVLPFVLIVAACGDDDEATVTTEPAAADTTVVAEISAEPTSPATTSPAPTTTRGPLTTSSATIVAVTSSTLPPKPGLPAGAGEEEAIADLAAREGADPAAITLVSVDNVTWRDSSIGCPEPGMQYMQVLTDGVRIVLELDGVRYEYHSGGSRDLFYCAKPAPPVGE